MADPNFAKVECLLDFAGTNGSTSIIDLGPENKQITVYGNAAISTAYSQFGTGSCLSLDGTGDYISYPTVFSPDCSFTIETGFRREDSEGIIVASGNDFYIQYDNTNIVIGDGASNNIVAAHGLTLNTWKHVALSFDGITFRFFVDGILKGSSTNLLKAKELLFIDIGARTPLSYYAQGQFDNYRHSTFARYTAAFTPPSAAHDTNNGILTGTITESLAVTNWRVTAKKVSDGRYNGSVLSGEAGTAYSISCLYAEASTIHIEPKIDGIWKANTVIVADEYRVPTNLATYPHLLKATSIGSVPHQTSGTEPTWSGSGPWTDGDITWTKIATLDDGMFKTLGPNMPA